MAMWGGRFSETTSQSVADFSESISYDQRLYKFDIQGSKAHAAMLGASGIIPEATSKVIIEELDKILERIEKGDFEFKQSLEDIHMNIESALIDKLGNEGARVHSARSRNDQVALDIRLYLRDEIKNIVELLKEFQKALVFQAEQNIDTIMPGFTHLQHAQVVSFAHHLLAYVEMFSRDIERLEDCAKRINVLVLGSGAIAGTTLPIDREMVCKLLNFERVSRNSMDAVADRDFTIELVNALAIFTMHCSRLSEDIILWCSQEFNFIELGDAFCTGSSLMPQKKNPDVAEITRGKTARVYGDLMALLTMCKGLPLTYNRDLQEDKEAIFDAIDTVKKILSVYPPMLGTLTPKKANMEKAANDPALMATDIAEELVKLGVPFRNAHHRVGSYVKYCKDNGKNLDECTLEEMQITIPEATAEFLTLFDPRKSVAKRNIVGATGFEQVAKQVKFWQDKLK